MSKDEQFFINRKTVKTVGEYDFKDDRDKESCGFDSETFNKKIENFGPELRKAFDKFFQQKNEGSIIAYVCKEHEDYFTKRELAYLLSAKFLGEVSEDIKKDIDGE